LNDTDPAQVEQDDSLSQAAAETSVSDSSANKTSPDDTAFDETFADHADADNGGDAEDDPYAEHDAAYAAHLAAEEEPPARPVFADLGLSAEVLRAVDDMGYRHPTPIQEQAIPVILMARDVLGVAQTGTGKTAGFTLPMLDILAGSRARARMPRSLILEPTRELALQVAENFVQYGKYLKLTHALIIGGESMTDQREVLNRGVDVLIATPGRLIDMFERGTVLLSDTRILVIDEADRMLDMGFIPDVERIVSLLPATRQTLFFSATMGPEIRRLADAFLSNPKEITVSRPASVAAGITEGLALVAPHDKREALRRLIRTQNVQNALIFCNRKTEVDILYKSLTRHKFSAGALHGDMAQTVRFTTLERFKAGELRLLVCSDVAAHGLDIGGLSHVFNFDVPHHAEDYVHRIGRTGRAGLEGHAFTIAAPEDRFAIEAIEKLTGHPIPPIIVEGLDPVDWAEGDGRKRRGRKSATPRKAPAKPARGKSGDDRPPRRASAAGRLEAEPIEATPDLPARATPPAPRSRAPRLDAGAPPRDRGAQSERATANDRPPARDRAASHDPVRVDEQPRDAAPRMRSIRDEPPRAEPPRAAHGERRPDERQRWRKEDLGPAVVGFGDDIPAFMMTRRAEPVPETGA
jgi:superfamily II DNA/RNA helicase